MNSCARKRNHAYEFMPFEENAQNEIHTARTKSHRITATSTPRVQLIQRTVQPTARTHTSTRTMRAYTRQSCTHIHASLARECDTISCILNGRALLTAHGFHCSGNHRRQPRDLCIARDAAAAVAAAAATTTAPTPAATTAPFTRSRQFS